MLGRFLSFFSIVLLMTSMAWAAPKSKLPAKLPQKQTTTKAPEAAATSTDEGGVADAKTVRKVRESAEPVPYPQDEMESMDASKAQLPGAAEEKSGD